MFNQRAYLTKKRKEIEQRPPYGVTTVYRGRGNYLQRLEQFEKAIQAYDEVLKWNGSDVRSLLGRSLARVKATYYSGALADAAKATELEPDNLAAQQLRAQTEYEKCRFERALVLAHHGKLLRICPPDFAECARHAEETIRECAGKSASKTLQFSLKLLRGVELRRSLDDGPVAVPKRVSRMQPQMTHQIEEISRVEKQTAHQISRLMASKYLERMAHDKYFLKDLCKDERLNSANKKGSEQLHTLAHKALADLDKRQEVLRERRPLYAARAAMSTARDRLSRSRKERLTRAQKQHITDAKRLLKSALDTLETRDTMKTLECAEFAMEQITKKPVTLLPGKEKFLQELYDVFAKAFLDQKRVRDDMNESDREKRAFVLLGLAVSREPSRDSVLKVRPLAPPRDVKQRIRGLDRAFAQSTRVSERCYLLHELSRHYADTKQAVKTRFYATKCQAEARNAGQKMWLINANFILARGQILQNNRPQARVCLLEAAALAKTFGLPDVAAFMDTCANVSTEGELPTVEDTVEKREKAMVGLMQDDEMKSQAEHLFRRMSTIPAARRFSVMPGTRADESAPPPPAGRRMSIMPRAAAPVKVVRTNRLPLGFQEFDI